MDIDISISSMKCICCEAEVEAEIRNKFLPDHWEIVYGLHCKAAGNYGSTVFDPDHSEWLDFVICDNCLLKKASLIKYTNHTEDSDVISFQEYLDKQENGNEQDGART